MSPADEGKREQWYLWLSFLALGVVFLARAPLKESLWLDETITAWVVNGSLQGVWRRAIEFQGQSPFYYSIEWIARNLLGSSELSLRFLSVFFGFGTLLILIRIARRLSLNAAVPIVAMAFLLASDSFQDAVLSARPYSTAIFFASLSLLLLLRLRDRFSVTDAAFFSLSIIATFYAHYLFGVMVGVHALILLREQALLRRLLPWMIISLVAVAPGFLQIVGLSERGASLSFSAPPAGVRLLKGAMPIAAVVSCLMGIALAVIWGGRINLDQSERRALRILFLYVLIPPLLFGIVSVLSPVSLWVPRYWSWVAVPFALILALLVCAFHEGRPRRIALIASLGFVSLRLVTQDRVTEEWREAAQLVQGSQERVVLFSGLIESEGTPQGFSAEYADYLRAPLSVYGVTGPIEVVGVTRAESEIQESLRPPFVLVAAHATREGYRSPGRFIDIAAGNGVNTSVELQGRLVSVVRGR